MEPVHAKFAKRFETALRRIGLQENSHGELVRRFARYRVSVTEQTVSNWRNGRHVPKLDQYTGLAQALNTDPGDLAFGRGAVAEAPTTAMDVPADIAATYAALGVEERDAVDRLIRLLGQRGRSARPAPRAGGTRSG